MAETWSDTPGQDQAETWSDTGSSPVTMGGTAAQLGRGAQVGVFHTLGAPADITAQQADQTSFAVQAAKDLYHLATTGQYGAKPTMPTHEPVPLGSEWMMTQAGQINPQLDPRNYPAQNWPERIARGAGDVGTQATLGRLGTTGFAPPAPSALTLGKQLIGAGIGGAGGGAGSQVGRGVAEHALQAIPHFSQLHPFAAQTIQDVGGVIGGGIGGLAGSGIANRAGIPAGLPAPDYSPKDLLNIADAQYKGVRNLNVNYQIPAIVDFAHSHAQNLYETYGSSGIMPILSKLNRLANPPSNAYAVPLTELTALDDALGKTVKAGRQRDGSLTPMASAASDTQTAIRNFIKNPTPDTVHSGDADLAAQMQQTADANWAAGKRGQTLAMAQAQGERPGKTIQGEIENMTGPYSIAKRLYGFSPEEKEQLKQFGEGTPARNITGGVASLLSPGHGTGIGATGLAALEGYREFGPSGLLLAGIPAGVGYGAHKLNEFLSRRALENIAQQTRQRSPAYQAIPFNERAASPFRTAVPVGLGMLSGLQQQ